MIQRRGLQPGVLTGRMTRTVFDANQRMAGTTPGTWLGAKKPEVALSAHCNDGTPAVPFEGRFIDGDRRVAYYTGRLVPAFRQLSPARRSAVIEQIARGRP